MREKIVLMDGYSILNRAFYGIPELTNSAGLHTNAVYGFCNIMFKILEEEKPSYLAVAFDVKAPTFRHRLYAGYKGTRKPMPQELQEQAPLLKELLGAMGIPVVEQAGMEADDIIGTLSALCKNQEMDVVVVSGDRDLLQLADPHVLIRIPKTKRTGTVIEDYGPAEVEALYGVTPREFIDVKALMGDSSDNIPGVPSIGEKTAIALIRTWRSIENAYEHRSEIKPPRAAKALEEHYGLARLSKELATICLDCKLDFSREQARLGELYTPAAYELCKKLEFKSLLNKFPDRILGAPGGTAPQKKRNVQAINSLTMAEAIYEEAKRASCLGLSVEADGTELTRVALTYDDSDTYLIETEGFITQAYLKSYLEELLKAICKRGEGYVGFLDLKRVLKTLFVPEDGCVWDLGIAAYLLNPLKSTYGYDDLARDYLGQTVPSRDDLVGRAAGKLSEEERAARGDGSRRGGPYQPGGAAGLKGGSFCGWHAFPVPRNRDSACLFPGPDGKGGRARRKAGAGRVRNPAGRADYGAGADDL